ncbi:hypothetical protein SAMN05444411_103190 [Lutibacter oricola]|uniref:Uncharacterized protein n=1 Tax=Lutibacter oricola TaxID=762486 RepID=A0A1H2ZC59_9FLAO|nr:hypothetical protein [Lutibacter oricola]SDX14339.1 hypothetical protein SAMN05444411_103190 [Lutibacter oricola]
MNISKKEKYTIITPKSNSVNEFYTQLEGKLNSLKEEHLIIDFSENLNIKIEEIALFLKLSEVHKQNGTSFVLIYDNLDIDDLPEELIVVPTITEAEDTIDMEAIERDLGF